MEVTNRRRMARSIPLELPSLEISLDKDSFSWSFTGQLFGASNITLEGGPRIGCPARQLLLHPCSFDFLPSSLRALLSDSLLGMVR